MYEPRFPAGVHLKGGRNAAPVLAELADAFYAPIIPIVVELRRQGLSLRAIARELDQRGIRTRIGGWYTCRSKLRIIRWSAAQVRRVLIRCANQAIKIWIDEQARGPFTKAQVKVMLNAGTITRETFFWRTGMPEWLPVYRLVDAADSWALARPRSRDG